MTMADSGDEVTRAEIESALAGRRLPRELHRAVLDAVSAVVGPARLEVALELATHFEDGLAQGRDADELLAAFGDGRLTARWIAREKSAGGVGLRRLENRGRTMIEALKNNLIYATRRLRKNPGFTLTAIVSLALGIGANTAIFSLVNAVMIRDLPYENPEELVEIYTAGSGFNSNPFSYPDFVDLREGTSDAFAGVMASGFGMAQTTVDGRPELLAAELVSANYFSLLGIRPALGRVFGAEDEIALDAHPVVILAHGFWQRVFGADPDVLGEKMELNGLSYTIVGVAPEDYLGNLRGIMPDLYAPIMMVNQLQPSSGNKLEQRGSHFLFVKGRLREGVTFARAQTAADAVEASLRERGIPDWRGEGSFRVIPTQDVILNPAVDGVILPAAVVVMGVVGLVLLVACANLASFLLARAVDARREVAIRLAMGAGRRTLIGQMLTENIMLALMGGAAGVVLAERLLAAVSRADLPIPIPIGFDLTLDASVLLFSLLISLLAGLIFGLIPAIQATNPDVAGVLRDEATSAGRGKGVALRNMIVVGQVAVSLFLLVTAGLFLRSLAASGAVDLGFGNEPAAVVSVVIPPRTYSTEEGRDLAYQLERQTGNLPGVRSAGIIDNLHLNPLNTQWRTFNVDGIDPPPGEPGHNIDIARIDRGFFEAAGIRLVRGRNFEISDVPDGDRVGIVSEALVDRFFPGEDPIGQLLHRDDEGETDVRIVGVASDAKVRSIGENPRPFLYLPISQDYSNSITIVAPTSVSPRETRDAIVRLVNERDPEIIIWDARTMAEHLSVMLLPQQLGAMVLGGFSVLALVLASVGLYGVVNHTVAQRTREVGIRLSLGAETGQVVRLLTGGGMKLVLLGSVLGMALSFVATRGLRGLLFGIGTLDPITFFGVPAALLLVGLVATYLPARRASRIDPVTALRAE